MTLEEAKSQLAAAKADVPQKKKAWNDAHTALDAELDKFFPDKEKVKQLREECYETCEQFNGAEGKVLRLERNVENIEKYGDDYENNPKYQEDLAESLKQFEVNDVEEANEDTEETGDTSETDEQKAEQKEEQEKQDEAAKKEKEKKEEGKSPYDDKLHKRYDSQAFSTNWNALPQYNLRDVRDVLKEVAKEQFAKVAYA